MRPFEPSFHAKPTVSIPLQGAISAIEAKPSQTTIQLEQLKASVHELERITDVLKQRLSPILMGSFEPKPEPAPKIAPTPLVGELSSISDGTLAVISQFHQIINNIDL